MAEPEIAVETPAATTPAAKETVAAAPQVDWGKLRESLPEDLRTDTSFQPIKSFEDLAKSYVNAQKAIGKEKLVLPDKHATPEDWQGVFTKLGNPAKIEDYKMNLPKDTEIDKEVLSQLTQVAHSKGVLPWQMEAVVEKFVEIAKNAETLSVEKFQAEKTNGIKALKDEWGKAFDSQVKKANAAFKHLLPEVADRQAIVELGLSNHPVVVRLLANAAKMMSDDNFVGAGALESVSLTPADALKKANDIIANLSHPYHNRAHPNHKLAKDEVRNLFAMASPEG